MHFKEKLKNFSDKLKNFGLEEDTDYFVENLSMMVGAGMDIISTLDSIAADVKYKRMKFLIEGLKKDINQGVSVWKALDNMELFPSYVVSLLQIGEKSGHLVDNLKIVVIQQERNRNFKSKIRSAMMYPIIVLSLTFVIGIGISWFILPRLSQVFDQLDVKLPFITKMLIGFGNFLGAHGTLVLPVFILFVIIVFYFMFIFKKTKAIGESILFHIPVINKLIKQIEIARFSYIFGTLLDAGIPIVDSADSLMTSVSYKRYFNFYAFLKANIEKGTSFQKIFQQYSSITNLIPPPVQNMIVAGEKSGKLSDTFIKIAQSYESKIEITTKNLSVIIEPILLVIIWAGVVFVAMAVILPIYSLVGGFKV